MMNGLGDRGAIEAARAALEREHGVRAMYCDADLAHADQIEQMLASAIQTFGGVDVLINNAVVRHAAPVDNFPPEAWDHGLAVNVTAAFHTIRLALPGMRKRNWGRIINVSSIYGLIGGVNRINYVVSKTALIGMTRAVALETRDSGITCNAICPGTVETPIHARGVEQIVAADGISREEAERRYLAGRQPGGHFIAAEDVAGMMLFLCGPDSRDITGAALPIDGGWSIQ